MKLALVTGADGFIGSHLTEFLLKKGVKVRAFCQYNSFGHCGWLDSLDKEVFSNIEIFFGDVRDYQLVENSSKKVDTIFHLASLIAISKILSLFNPDNLFIILSTAHLRFIAVGRDLIKSSADFFKKD